MLKVGCCGFPGGMSRYFQEFEVVEVQSTFYNLPRIETAKNWREKAPDGFEFAMKAWQGITHPPDMPTWRRTTVKIPESRWGRYGFFRPTEEVFGAWTRTREICHELNAICLMQCPERFDASEAHVADMKRFFSQMDRGRTLIAWEPRGPTWRSELVEPLCRELDLIYCVDPFARPIPTFQETVYLRLHGRPPGDRMYYYKYSDSDLRKLKDLIWRLGPDRRVYCFFNNVTMKEDARRFLELTRRA